MLPLLKLPSGRNITYRAVVESEPGTIILLVDVVVPAPDEGIFNWSCHSGRDLLGGDV